jgi:hypothetical protein
MLAMPAYRCPSSNGQNAVTLESDARGPLADYVVLVAKYTTVGNPVTNTAANLNPGRGFWHYFVADFDASANPNHQANMRTFVGPLRLPNITSISTAAMISDKANPGQNYNDANRTLWARSISDWTYNDTFAYWQRGTSNQLVFGEKHIPEHALRPRQSEQARWNGGYQFIWEGAKVCNVARCVSDHADLFAKSPQQPETARRSNIDPQWGGDTTTNGGLEGRFTLGSSHPGMVNFLIGDGSVRGIPKTTNPRLVWDLTNAVDSATASLP